MTNLCKNLYLKFQKQVGWPLIYQILTLKLQCKIIKYMLPQLYPLKKQHYHPSDHPPPPPRKLFLDLCMDLYGLHTDHILSKVKVVNLYFTSDQPSSYPVEIFYFLFNTLWMHCYIHNFRVVSKIRGARYSTPF